MAEAAPESSHQTPTSTVSSELAGIFHLNNRPIGCPGHQVYRMTQGRGIEVEVRESAVVRPFVRRRHLLVVGGVVYVHVKLIVATDI